MRNRSKQRWMHLLLAALMAGALGLGATGCEKSPEDQLRTAKGAVMSENPDRAEEALEAVLAAKPDSFEAQRLMAQVHRLRGNYEKAEEKLRALWTEAGFDDEAAELSTKQKQKKQMLADNLVEVYRQWAESLDSSENPDKFEEVVRKGLELEPKSNRLNTMLVDFYESRAKKLVEQGEKVEAADAYEKILDLRTLPAKRKKAKERATNLRFEANKEQMLGYFNEKAKAKLERQDRYNEEDKTILLSMEKSLDSDMEQSVEKAISESKGQEVDLKRRNKQHAAIICDVAMRQELVPAIKEVIVEATGIPADSDFSKMSVPASVNKGVAIEAGRRDCELTATLPLEAVLKMGFEVKEQTRKAAEKAKEAGDKAGEDKAKEGGEAKAEADKADEKE